MDIAGFSDAGFVNVTTSDDVVHAQVKQTGKFSFVRIFESGHEVPFYQPVVSLEMLERAIKGLDIATGKVEVSADYKTDGTPTSTYWEGNSTVQYSVVPVDSTYNITTNEPDPPSSSNSTTAAATKQRRKRRLTSFLPRRPVAGSGRGNLPSDS